MTSGRIWVLGFKANLRDMGNPVFGKMTNQYKVIWNENAFAFTDTLLGEGIIYGQGVPRSLSRGGNQKVKIGRKESAGI